MKKLIFALVLASLVGASAVYATEGNVNADGRVKISSPSEMRHFRDIVKRGHDLFGFRLAAALEKIPNPGEIKNFEGIRKIGTALWGFRKTFGSAMITADAKVCVGNAITKKDGSLKTALNSFASKTNTAIDARTACQINLTSLPTAAEQQNANLTCSANYQASMKTNLKDLRTARNNAWNTYKTDMKACGSANAEIKLDDGGAIEDIL